MSRGINRTLKRADEAQQFLVEETFELIAQEVTITRPDSADPGLGTISLGSFAKGEVCFFGGSATLTLEDADGGTEDITADFAGNVSVGTAAAALSIGATATAFNLIPEGDVGPATLSVAGPTFYASRGSSGGNCFSVVDNTGDDTDIILNIEIDAADMTIDTTGTITVTGYVTVTYKIFNSSV